MTGTSNQVFINVMTTPQNKCYHPFFGLRNGGSERQMRFLKPWSELKAKSAPDSKSAGEGSKRTFLCVLIQGLLNPCSLPSASFLHSLCAGVRFLHRQLSTFSSEHSTFVFGRRHVLRHEHGFLLTLPSTHMYTDLQKTSLF